jgi:hypothetical protein
VVYEKRRARRRWQNSRNPPDKTYPNRLSHSLQTASRQTKKNETFNHYITELSTTGHSIWKATKEFETPIAPIGGT